MDGTLSSVHRSRQLLDLVDPAWLIDSLSEDELHINDGGNGGGGGTNVDLTPDEMHGQSDDGYGACILTDREGASWSLDIGKHSHSELAASQSGLAPSNGPNDIHGLTTLGTFGSGFVNGASTNTGFESADGLRWNDLALDGFIAAAQNQPNQ